MTFLLAAWELLKKLPWWVYLVAALIALHYYLVFVAVHENSIGWQKKIDAMVQAQQAEVAVLNAKYRQQEQQHQAQVNAVEVKYENDLAEMETQRRADVVAARSGALKLRIPPDPSPPAQAGPTAPVSDGQARGELPPEVAANLLTLADDADQVVQQLTACQAVLEAER